MDIDLGFKDKKGREVYLTLPLFRYIRDLFGWFGGPRKMSETLWNKLLPTMKLGLETAINYSVWMRRSIVHPGAPFMAGVKDWGEYAVRNLTPYGTFAPRSGEVRTMTEALIPLLGTWVRHGLVGGTPAHWLLEFKLRRGYVIDKLDNEIAELIQKGDVSGAIQEMVVNGRYSDAEQIKRRLTQYNYQLLDRWNTLSKEQQAEFLQSLPPDRVEKFIAAISKR